MAPLRKAICKIDARLPKLGKSVDKSLRHCLETDDVANAEAVWDERRIALKHAILTRDSRSFLRWPEIRESIFVGDAPFVWEQFRWLRTHQRWPEWKELLMEDRLGRPTRHPLMLRSSGNLITKVYEWARFTDSGARATDFASVIEIGGGFGAMRRLLGRAGFNGEYAIFDLPEVLCLARYYLHGTRFMNRTQLVSAPDELPTLPRPRLAVATWSLSEMPLSLRSELEERNVLDANAFLIGYQETFRGIDNAAYFSDFVSRHPAQWHREPIAAESSHMLLLGHHATPSNEG